MLRVWVEVPGEADQGHKDLLGHSGPDIKVQKWLLFLVKHLKKACVCWGRDVGVRFSVSNSAKRS